MPSDTAIRGLFWNMDELSAAGLPGNTGPRTWDDFAAFVQKLNRFDASGSPVQLGFVPWAGNWTWYGWLWTFGGDYFDPKAFAPHVNSPRDIQAFEWIASYAKSEGTLNALAALGFGKEWSPAGFLNGKTAMIVSYNYAFDSVKVPFNFFAGPMPYPAGGTNGTWPGGYAFVVPKGTPQSDAIARFLNYVVATDTQTRWYKETGALPSTLAALQMVLNQSTPMQRALLAQSASAHWRWPFTNIIHTVVNTAYRNVANLTVPPKQALDQAQQRLMADHPEIWGQI